MANRDTYRYTLRQGNKIVYVGITNDPGQREARHRADGKRFSSMRVEGPRVTRNSAERWESTRLATYRDNHSGRSPRYNNTKNG